MMVDSAAAAHWALYPTLYRSAARNDTSHGFFTIYFLLVLRTGTGPIPLLSASSVDQHR
jgi:hypothetical protein